MRRFPPSFVPLLVLSGLLLSLLSCSGRAEAPPATQPGEADAVHQDNLRKYKGNEDVLVLPGLVADRKAKTVRLWATATGMSENDPIEFWLIHEASGKDYEALAITPARPSDVLKALQFIGLEPGKPVSLEENRAWPKGERINLMFEWQDAAEGAKEAARKVPAVQLLIDTRTNKPLAHDGLMFVGSHWIEPAEPEAEAQQRDPQQRKFAADVNDARSIASTYNEPSTILDVPTRAPQSEVYGFQRPNPEHLLKKGTPVQVVLEPQLKDGTRRITDVNLALAMPAGKSKLQEAEVTLSDAAGKPLAEQSTLVHALAALGKLTEQKKDVYITLRPADNVPVGIVQALYRMLEGLEGDGGIRIDAPAPAEIYHRSLLAGDEWRDAKERLSTSWDLRLKQENGHVLAQLVRYHWSDEEGEQTRQTLNAASGQEVARILSEKDADQPSLVVVFAPPGLLYGDLKRFLVPGMETHPWVVIYLDQAPTTREGAATRP